MKKKVLINILIGKEEEDLLKLIDKKELKKIKKTIKRIKPTLDRLGKKETTDEDIKKFIKLIEQNIIKTLLEKINSIIDDDVCFDIKNCQRLVKEESEDNAYYEGHWVGMDAVRVDYLWPLKEELEKEIKK